VKEAAAPRDLPLAGNMSAPTYLAESKTAGICINNSAYDYFVFKLKDEIK